ncbi:MAG: LptA/(LptD N-terminal domain) transport protein [Verrucomicrobiota bacterium]|jgi:lipopolysaccharide export system protein LptA
MNVRSYLLLALLAGLAVASAQNNLFSPSTTAPVPAKAGPGAQGIEVEATGGGTFSLTTGTATYKTNVRVNDPQFFLRCESLRLLLDLKSLGGTNAAPATPAPTNAPPLTAMGGRIREAEALENVVFSNKVDATQAFADRLVYQVTNDAFELTGNVRVIRGEFTSRAPKFLYYRAKGEFVSIGESTMTFTPANTNAPAKKL